MLHLRPYRPADAEKIASWVTDETIFYRWSAGRHGEYPMPPERLNEDYAEALLRDDFFAWTAYDEQGPAGHLITRFTDAEKKVLRLGFVVVDSTRRGKGYGRELIRLALRYAFDVLQVERVTIGVFADNLPARRCYQAAGFTEVPGEETYELMGENWTCIEMSCTSH